MLQGKTLPSLVGGVALAAAMRGGGTAPGSRVPSATAGPEAGAGDVRAVPPRQPGVGTGAPAAAEEVAEPRRGIRLTLPTGPRTGGGGGGGSGFWEAAVRTDLFPLRGGSGAFRTGRPEQVVDLAGVVLGPGQKAGLRSDLERIRRRTGAEVVVVTVDRLHGGAGGAGGGGSRAAALSPRAYATALFNHWRVGSSSQASMAQQSGPSGSGSGQEAVSVARRVPAKAEERNDGVLVLVVTSARRVEVVVGKGLDATKLNDQHRRGSSGSGGGWVRGMLEAEAVPAFRAGDYGQGLRRVVRALGDALEEESAAAAAAANAADGAASAPRAHGGRHPPPPPPRQRDYLGAAEPPPMGFLPRPADRDTVAVGSGVALVAAAAAAGGQRPRPRCAQCGSRARFVVPHPGDGHPPPPSSSSPPFGPGWDDRAAAADDDNMADGAAAGDRKVGQGGSSAESSSAKNIGAENGGAAKGGGEKGGGGWLTTRAATWDEAGEKARPVSCAACGFRGWCVAPVPSGREEADDAAARRQQQRRRQQEAMRRAQAMQRTRNGGGGGSGSSGGGRSGGWSSGGGGGASW